MALLSSQAMRYTTRMWKFIKMLIGIALVPFAWAVSMSVYELCQSSTDAASPVGWEAWALPIGFVAWVVIFFLLPRPMRTYVLGHELTHALWAIIMGGRIGKMKISKKGGHVELTKTNFFIALAPYFFPFYTTLVIAAYYLAGVWIDVEAYQAWWLVAIGLTWSFHLTFTIHMLAQRQPDIQSHGRLFSYVFIYIGNVVFIGLWIVLVGTPNLGRFGELLGRESAAAYSNAIVQLGNAWNYCLQRVGSSG